MQQNFDGSSDSCTRSVAGETEKLRVCSANKCLIRKNYHWTEKELLKVGTKSGSLMLKYICGNIKNKLEIPRKLRWIEMKSAPLELSWSETPPPH